jgi:hypothetical protein
MEKYISNRIRKLNNINTKSRRQILHSGILIKSNPPPIFYLINIQFNTDFQTPRTFKSSFSKKFSNKNCLHIWLSRFDISPYKCNIGFISRISNYKFWDPPIFSCSPCWFIILAAVLHMSAPCATRSQRMPVVKGQSNGAHWHSLCRALEWKGARLKIIALNNMIAIIVIL